MTSVGWPRFVVHHRSADEVFRRLEARGAVIDLDASEVEPPELEAGE